MKIELNRTSEDFSQELHLEESPEALELKAEGATFEKPIKVELLVSKNQDQLICHGKVTATLKLECSRCLARYDQKMTSDLDFVVDLTGNSSEGKSEEEGYFVADPSSTFFEIDDLVREAIIISLPLKPLCSKECKGLCPVCGIELNRSQCNCVREETDPRWDQLKGLSKKDS
ncbi:MAG: DUF177 domain-containing protein [Candidatus Zixiibacteriota bacterium]|nr:MAG: DUF177 domain-containing protein [candidate division Zixibacteria bacterium]